MDSIFSEKYRESWNKLSENVEPARPSVGKMVEVVKGRKHKGKAGEVVWHGENRYFDWKYYSSAQITLMQMQGRSGYRVRVKTYDGEMFYVNADYVEVLQEQPNE